MRNFEHSLPRVLRGPCDAVSSPTGGRPRPTPRTLRFAAEVIEYTAYEEATRHSARVIGHLIDLAAQLQAIADRMDAQESSEEAGPGEA